MPESGPAAAPLELFGSSTCPWTAEWRERLVWEGRDFVEHDVEADAGAFARMTALTGGGRTVPVLVEDGRVVEVGWQGRGCMVDAPGGSSFHVGG